MANLDKHIWEGWTVQDFIDDLDLTLSMIQSGNSWRPPISHPSELKEWCMDNQPHYKKHVPEVVAYFANKYQIR